MRLCLVSPHFPPDISGMGDYTYFLARALADIGCLVEVLTSVGESDPTLYPPHRGVRVYRVVKGWGVADLPKLVAAVRALQSDTLFLQYTPHAYERRGMTLGVNLLPALIRATAGKRVVLNFHELYLPFDWSPKHCIGALWQRSMAFLIGASSNSLTAISSEWPRGLRRVGLYKGVRVIAVGSNIPRAEVTPTELARIRARLAGGRNALLVGCFGATGPHRDVALLRDAIKMVRRRHTLGIVWLGKSGAGGPGLSDDRITWTGPLPHPEVSRIMSACDVFVLPFSDGVSTKRGTLAAALLHELPIVTTRGNSIDEIFLHGDNLYLVPVGDSEALARGLLEVADSADLRTRLARGARVLHSQHFAWDVIARQVVSAIIN
jgi:glycosyltransferase involved in cell wall biosynthesis